VPKHDLVPKKGREQESEVLPESTDWGEKRWDGSIESLKFNLDTVPGPGPIEGEK